MRKLSILVFMVFSLLLSGMTLASMKMDITSPADPVKGVPDDSDWPPAEAPLYTIDDNVNTKYLHFKGHLQPTGFAVTPKYWSKVVNEITLTTANDCAWRDPVSFELHGSNDSIDGPWTLIASGDIVDFSQPAEWPRFTKNETPITFDNDVAYTHYQVLFTAIRDPGQNNYMQIAEVELLTTLPPLPAGWAYKDIGTTGGVAWESNGSVIVIADGHEISNNSDGFGYVYRPISGDATLDVELTSMQNTGYDAKAGPMIRETLDPGSKHGMTAHTMEQQGIEFVWRPVTDGPSMETPRAGVFLPRKLRIIRAGNVVTSKFGEVVPFPPFFKWTTVDSQIIEMGADCYIGIAVSSASPGVLNTSVFQGMVLTAAPYYKPWDLNPPDGSEGISTTPTLTWRAGDEAVSHDVYFGTSIETMELVATKALGDESYTPDTPLEQYTTYYWVIVEQPTGQASPVMSFTTLYALPWWTGTIRRELWDNSPSDYLLRGTDSYRYLQPPTYTDERTIATSPNIGWEYYIGRLIGHLIPSKSGDYTFWIAADDGSELFLSADTGVCDPVRIAYWDWYSGNYDAHTEQMSAPIHLVAGQKYLIQAVWKEGTGGDWVNVAWEGPDAPSRTEIIGQHLTTAFAVNPKPAIKAMVTPKEAENLSWSPGKFATQQEVFFGTDPGAMGSIATLPADPAVLAETSTIPAPPVVAGNTYYWQVNCTDGTDVWEGDVWSFTVSEWINRDLGRYDTPGSHTYDSGTGTHVITADGGDIWNDWDEFHFYYTTPKFTRDTGTIIARVLSLQETNQWAKAGVMIRQSLSANSKYTSMMTTPETWNQRATFQWRDCDGCWSGSVSDGPGVLNPEWVKLVRSGNIFKGYHSDDGVNWHHHGDHYVEMNSDVYVGLAVTSHSGGNITTALIDNLSITTPDPRQAWGPIPSDDAVGVNIHSILQWGAGDGATQHYLYFSEDEEAVINREALVATLPADVTEYNPFPSDRQTLDLGKTYYWAVDEQYNPVFPGEVWSFTVEEYRLLEDFESYSIAPEPLPEQVFVPGEILIEAVPPPEQEEIEAGYTVTAEEPPEQICIDPGVIVEPGYTIPGYTIEAVAPDAGCLIAEWAFEGNYDDTSGSGFHGTPQGDATIVADADRGNVLSLDGDGDYVDCNNPAALNFGTGNWSVSTWIKSTVGNEQGVPFGNGGDGGGGIRYTLGLGESNTNKMTLTVDDNADKLQAHSGTNVADDVWHHFLGVRDGDTIKLYVDGNPDGSASLPAGYDLSGTSQANVYLGCIWNQGSSVLQKFFTGLIDDVQVYDCNLTEGNARYLAGVGDKEVPPVEVPPVIEGAIYRPLLLHYEFEDNARDSSSNEHHGTVVPKGSWPRYGDSQAGLGRAIEFNDDGDHVLDDDSEDYMDGLDQLTISCWIKSEKTDRDEGWVHFGTEWSDKRSFRYDKQGASSNRLRKVIKYGVATTGGNEEDESSYNVQTTNWQHVAMTWQSGQGIKLYIDGVLDQPGWDAGSVSGVLQGYSQLLVGKGSKDDGGGESWNGFVDDLRIYSTALSYGQIRYLAGEMDDLEVPPRYGPMIAGYDFEGDATDMSGNNFHGTLKGNASIVDGVLNLDGDGDCVDLGRDNMFNPGAGPFGISAWIKMSGWGGNWGNVIVSNRGENGRGWQLRRRGSSLRLVLTTRGCSNDDPEGNIEPPLNEWVHVAAVRDGTSKRLYINGVLDNNAGINSNPIRMAGHNAYIGGRANRENTGMDNAWFNGLIDDVQVYNHVFTEGELRYLAGLGDLKLPDLYLPMLLHLEFEGNLEDSSGNEKHGTAIGEGITIEDDPDMGQVLSLPGGDNIFVQIPPVGNSGDMPVSIACWAKADHTSIPDWTLIFGFSTPGGNCGSHFNIGSIGGPGGVGAHTWCMERTIFTDEQALEWRHYAMTWDGGTVRYYGDGIQVGQYTHGDNLWRRGDYVNVGKRNTQASSFPGDVDDARIYNYPLNLGQIRMLAQYYPPNMITDVWSGRASAVPVMEWKLPAHGGAQSMRVEYTGSGAVTRLDPFGDGAHPHGWNGDWTLGDAKSMSMWFKGDLGNAPGQMFAQVTTGVSSGNTQRVIYDGDPQDLLIPRWQPWDISLQELGTGKPDDPPIEEGLPLTKIKEFGVGVIGAGGGVLYFDDMRLYPTRCVPKYGPAHDVTGDCIVDGRDMAVIADAWLAQEGDNGLWYEYFELAEGEPTWSILPDFWNMLVTKQGTADNFGVGLRLRGDDFGFLFTGIVVAPVAGDYTFYTDSDDGSKLYIDNQQVVDNDGLHGMNHWRQGTINLDAGEHLIEVTQFERGGGEGLAVQVEGPGIPRTPIPNEVLFLAPGIPADFNGDGIVNFSDYADILNHLGDEVLFPSE